MKANPLAVVPLACPIDGLALATGTTDTEFRCASGHTYDLARQGYLNALPVQFKPSRAPGDSREMVAARGAVLDTGLFEPLAAELVNMCREASILVRSPAETALIIDAGCGDGYYSHYLHSRLTEQEAGTRFLFLGADISRPAILAATRRSAEIGWVVANNTQLPVLLGRADCILSVFGFETWSAWATLQKPQQHVITVDAGPDHLLELREILYDRVRRHVEPVAPDVDAGYQLLERRPLRWRRQVNDADLLLNLIAMTPHIHRATATAIRLLQTKPVADVTFDVVMRIYRRIP